MNWVEFFLKTNKKLIILILGVNTDLSNHHIYAEKLVSDINTPKNGDLKFTYMKIQDNEDIDYSKITQLGETGLVISSNYPLEREYIDFVIYLDTSLKILKSRGLSQRIDTEGFKNNYKISKFVNDTSYKQFNTLGRISENPAYDKLWDIVIDLIMKN